MGAVLVHVLARWEPCGVIDIGVQFRWCGTLSADDLVWQFFIYINCSKSQRGSVNHLRFFFRLPYHPDSYHLKTYVIYHLQPVGRPSFRCNPTIDHHPDNNPQVVLRNLCCNPTWSVGCATGPGRSQTTSRIGLWQVMTGAPHVK